MKTALRSGILCAALCLPAAAGQASGIALTAKDILGRALDRDARVKATKHGREVRAEVHLPATPELKDALEAVALDKESSELSARLAALPEPKNNLQNAGTADGLSWSEAAGVFDFWSGGGSFPPNWLQRLPCRTFFGIENPVLSVSKP